MKTCCTVAAKICFCGLFSIIQKLAVHPHKRLDQLMQPARSRHPVVHLGVDVDRIIAVPRRQLFAVPESLQVCRLTAGAGTGNQQISSKIKHQRFQCSIVRIFFVLQNPFPQIQLLPAAFRKFQFNPVKKLLILCNMFLLQYFKRALAPVQICFQQRCRICSFGLRMAVCPRIAAAHCQKNLQLQHILTNKSIRLRLGRSACCAYASPAFITHSHLFRDFRKNKGFYFSLAGADRPQTFAGKPSKQRKSIRLVPLLC